MDNLWIIYGQSMDNLWIIYPEYVSLNIGPWMTGTSGLLKTKHESLMTSHPMLNDQRGEMFSNTKWYKRTRPSIISIVYFIYIYIHLHCIYFGYIIHSYTWGSAPAPSPHFLSLQNVITGHCQGPKTWLGNLWSGSNGGWKLVNPLEIHVLLWLIP